MAITAGDEIKASEINAGLNAKVNNTGNETVAGIKTFSSIPVLPASNPTTDNQAVRKLYVDNYKWLAGDILMASADTERSFNLTDYTLKKEIQVFSSGTIRVKFTMSSAGGPPHSVSGRLYVNGVAVGTERTQTSAAFIEYSEDITVVAGDLVQAYFKDVDFYGSVKNFRIYVAATDKTTVNTD